MFRYVLTRLGMAIVVLLLAVVFLACMAYLAPGDPVKAILGPMASADLSRRVREQTGLDKPILMQVLDLVVDAFYARLGHDSSR